jgi:hypothetical protein
MEKSAHPNGMDPVWILFLRRLSSRLAYWLSALGYNLRDRTMTNRLYLIYFCAFWLGWVVAIFALLGSSLAGAFLQAGLAMPPQLVVGFCQYALIAWALIQLWNAARRSPFVFSEEDAYLLCQTPASRRTVGFAWFIQNWIETVLFFIAVTIVFSFSLVEWRLRGVVSITDIPEFFAASFRALTIVVPLQMALQAGLWSIGAVRLRGAFDLPWLRWLSPGTAVILAAVWFLPGLFAALISPLSFPIQIAFLGNISTGLWLAAVLLSLAYLAIAIYSLAFSTQQMNLSRAAQETTLYAAVTLARSYGMSGLADALLLRRRLGKARAASRLPARPGMWMLIWKDAIQSHRSFRLSQALSWLSVFGTSLGMFLSTNFYLQLVFGGFWTIVLAGLTSHRLRNDLARWWLLRSLPLRMADLLVLEVGSSWGLGVLMGWLALAFTRLPLAYILIAAVLLPVLGANAALSNVYDILRRSKARELMSPSIAEENVPRQNVVGVLLGLVSVLIPFGILAWSLTQPAGLIFSLAALAVGAFITLLNWNLTLSAYRWI